MQFFRHRVPMRVIGATLLASLVPAVVSPVLAADPSAASPWYAEWLERRVDRDLPSAVRALMEDAAREPSAGLEDFVRRVVRTAAREEGLAFTSMALAGRVFGSEAELAAFLLSGTRSLGASAIPPGTLTGTVEAPSAPVPRIDRGLPAADLRAPGAPASGGTANPCRPEPVRPADPSRGCQQTLGP